MIEMRELRTGTPAPNFRLMSAGGREIELSTYRRRQPVLLIFLSADADDKRLQDFAAEYAEFRSENVEILAIIRRSVDEVRSLAERLDLPFPVLPDPDGAVHQGYLGSDSLGQVLLDRYNAVQVRESGSDAARFMPPRDALSWATFGEFSCSSTGIAQSPTIK
jgi:peroxiredoxin